MKRRLCCRPICFWAGQTLWTDLWKVQWSSKITRAEGWNFSPTGVFDWYKALNPLNSSGLECFSVPGVCDGREMIKKVMCHNNKRPISSVWALRSVELIWWAAGQCWRQRTAAASSSFLGSFFFTFCSLFCLKYVKSLQSSKILVTLVFPC